MAAMLIEAAARVPEVEISLYCESNDEATRDYKNRMIAPLRDLLALTKWVASVDFITFEHEHVDLELLKAVPGIEAKLRPNSTCVAISQDRELEKKTFQRLSIPVAPWCTLGSDINDVPSKSEALIPGIVKTATHGYDGKGQVSVSSKEHLTAAMACLVGHRCVLEKRIPFLREVSQVSVRSLDGTMQHYPLVENIHRAGILSVTKAPAAAYSELAQNFTSRLATDLDYVGTLAVEFFVMDDGLLANEWAPRVHNSGHWTIEGAKTSQFENHLRAVAGLPIGDCTAHQPTTMWNIFGCSRSDAEAVVQAVKESHPKSSLFLHWYGKSPRPGRKVGHITICEEANSATNQAIAAQVDRLQITE